MLEELKKSQSFLYDFVTKSVNNGKISHAYLLETNGVSNKDEIALSLAKFFLLHDKDEKTISNVSHLIDSGNYPDLIIIDSQKEIKKEQIVELKDRFSLKPIYNDYLIYIIKDASKLNQSSANTLLKFLEEPDSNVIAILLSDNVSLVIDTIVSRCQILTLNPSFASDTNTVLELVNNNDLVLDDVVNFFVTLEKEKESFIAFSDYGFKDKFSVYLEIGLYLYMDCLKNYDTLNFQFSSNALVLKKIVENNLISDIIKKIEVINKFKTLMNYNVNKDLIIDNFVISFVR